MRTSRSRNPNSEGVIEVMLVRSRPFGPGRSGPARCFGGYRLRDARSCAVLLRDDDTFEQILRMRARRRARDLRSDARRNRVGEVRAYRPRKRVAPVEELA